MPLLAPCSLQEPFSPASTRPGSHGRAISRAAVLQGGRGTGRSVAAASSGTRRRGRPAIAFIDPTRAMMPALRCARMADVVTAGLRNYVRQRAAQISVLGAGGIGLAVLLQHAHWSSWVNDVATQVAQHPSDLPPEAWVLLLVGSNLARVAVCGALCFATARYYDQRRQRGEEVAILLASRQSMLHRFSAEMLERLHEAGVDDEMGSVAAFRDWYTAQLAASDAQLRQLEGWSGGGSEASQHLLDTLERLGLTTGNRNGGWQGGPEKVQGPVQSIRTRRIHGVKKRRDPLVEDRERLERVLRLRPRVQHHATFQAYLQEQQAVLERCLQEPPQPEASSPPSPTPPPEARMASQQHSVDGGGGGNDVGGSGSGRGGGGEGGTNGSGSGSSRGRKKDGSCTSDDMLAAFDEGDCTTSAEGPDLSTSSCDGGEGDAGTGGS